MHLKLVIDVDQDSLWCRTEQNDEPQLRNLLEEAAEFDEELLFEQVFPRDDPAQRLSDHLKEWTKIGYDISIADGAPLDETIYEFGVLNFRVPDGKVDIPGLHFVGLARQRSRTARKSAPET